MSARLEELLARLYTDAELRERFLAGPDPQLLRDAGLGSEDVAALARIDRVGLALAAESFRRKREGARRRHGA